MEREASVFASLQTETPWLAWRLSEEDQEEDDDDDDNDDKDQVEEEEDSFDFMIPTL